MRVLNNIPRISPPERDEFQRNYVATKQPVIITGLFDGQPIRRVDSAGACREQFGGLPLEVRDEYTEHFRAWLQDRSAPAVGASEAMTLRDYLRYIELHPETSKMCIEEATPPEVARSAPPPPLFRERPGDALVSKWFLGKKGLFAHLHFDRDQREVLFYQVFGVKRVALIRPSQSYKLHPIGQVSGLCLEAFDEEDKRRLFESTRAFETLLYPGETLYMPVLHWHYIEYVDTGMSINFRYPRNRYNKFLGDNLAGNVLAQRLGERLSDESANPDEAEALFRRVYDEYRKPHDSRVARHRAVQAALRELAPALGDCPRPYVFNDAALEQSFAEVQIEDSDRYSADRQVDPPPAAA